MNPGTHRAEGWVGPRGGLKVFGEQINLFIPSFGSVKTTNFTVNHQCGDMFRLIIIIRPIREPYLRYIE